MKVYYKKKTAQDARRKGEKLVKKGQTYVIKKRSTKKRR